MYEMPPIPECLIRRATDERAPIIKVKAARKAKKHPFHLPRNMEPASWALLKQIEAEKKAKREARFAALRELKRR